MDLGRAAELLRNGGLVALPTETVYGLGANALDPRAVERIYRVKGRPPESPLIVHVASIGMARELAAMWPEEAERLASQYWPGPLTLVVPKRDMIPDIVTAGLPTVGLRMPAHPIALEVIRLAGVPIAAPSANRFTELSPTTARHVEASLGSAVDLIVDGGPCAVGIESTVLSLAGPAPVLLRPGMISREEIETALGRGIEVARTAEGAHPSPGMHEKHYSPRTPVFLTSEAPAGRGVCLFRSQPVAAEVLIRMPENAVEYAQLIYDALHQADETGADWIVVEPLPNGPEWAGIADRLRRAATR